MICFASAVLFFMMQSLSQQRATITFCFLLGKNAAETVVMLKTAYKDDAMGKTPAYFGYPLVIYI